MDIGDIVIAIVLSIIGIVGFLQLFGAISVAKEGLDFFYNKVKWRTPVTRADYIRYNKILTSKVSYYNNLGADGRAKFVNRIIYFMRTKNWIGKNGLKVTEEMKVLVSASAVQLTFGLDKFMLKHYERIFLYPTTFYSKLMRVTMKGGTSPSGHMFLSWKDYLHGYEVADDKYNLGLHEMAHALKLTVTHANDFDTRFASYINNWEAIGSNEFQKMNHGGKSILRKYGGTNMHEFFSVCVEHFFEAPEELIEHLPDIYNHLCVLLNQTPLNTRGDYALADNFAEKANKEAEVPVPKIVRRKFNHDNFQWSLNVWMIGFMFGIPLMFLLKTNTYFPDDSFTWLFFSLAAVGAVLHFKKLVLNKEISWVLYPLYCVTGFAPFACVIFILLNRGISWDVVEQYPIENVRTIRENVSVHFKLKDGMYNDFSPALEMPIMYYERPGKSKTNRELEITFRQGVLGFKSFKKNKVITIPPK